MIEPYLMFRGDCEAALTFYCQALGAQVEMLMRFNEAPDPVPGLRDGWETKVMHASLRVGKQRIMASDGMGSTQPFAGFNLSVSLPTIKAVHRTYDALLVGGTATMPVSKTFWSEAFGMLTDAYGVSWMVMHEAT